MSAPADHMNCQVVLRSEADLTSHATSDVHVEMQGQKVLFMLRHTDADLPDETEELHQRLASLIQIWPMHFMTPKLMNQMHAKRKHKPAFCSFQADLLSRVVSVLLVCGPLPK